MLASAGSDVNLVYLVVVIVGTVITTWVALWATVMRPRSKQRREAENAEEERQELRNQVIDGIPAVPGMTHGVPQLAFRMKAVEESVLTLARRVDETNGTGRRSEGKIDLLLSNFPDIKVPAELVKN